MADYLTPAEIAQSVVESSKKKAALPIVQMVVLGMLAGAYIAFGGLLAIVVGRGSPALMQANPGLGGKD